MSIIHWLDGKYYVVYKDGEILRLVSNTGFSTLADAHYFLLTCDE